MESVWPGNSSSSSRSGLAISVGLHVVLIAGLLLWSRFFGPPFIVAAGPGDGGEGGGGAIQVGVTDASAILGFAAPKPITQIGNENKPLNNAVLEHEQPEDTNPNDILTPPKPKTQDTVKTKLPVADQHEKIFTGKPELGKSNSTSALAGRTYGAATPATVGGIAIGPGTGTGNGLPGGSEYGRRIQQILSRNYNPPVLQQVPTQYVKIDLRIARDGSILSISNGRVGLQYFKQRSGIQLVNDAAERAILVSKLPPFPGDFLRGSSEAVAEIWFKYPK